MREYWFLHSFPRTSPLFLALVLTAQTVLYLDPVVLTGLSLHIYSITKSPSPLHSYALSYYIVSRRGFHHNVFVVMYKVSRLAWCASQTGRILYISKQSRTFSNTIACRMATITDAIKKDHSELQEYYNNIINARDNDTATRWQNQFTWELAQHSIAEELVVYPVFEKNLGAKGHSMAEKDQAEHQSVRAFFFQVPVLPRIGL